MASKSKKAFKVAAVLTIREAADLTPARRKEMAEWLRKQAKFLLKEGQNFSKRFTGRYNIYVG